MSDHVCPGCGRCWSDGAWQWDPSRGACTACEDAVTAALRAYFGGDVTEERAAELAIAQGLVVEANGMERGSNIVQFALTLVREQNAHNARLVEALLDDCDALLTTIGQPVGGPAGSYLTYSATGSPFAQSVERLQKTIAQFRGEAKEGG